MTDYHPFGKIPDDPTGLLEERANEMIRQSAYRFALFERQWRKEQREKKRQEQEPKT